MTPNRRNKETAEYFVDKFFQTIEEGQDAAPIYRQLCLYLEAIMIYQKVRNEESKIRVYMDHTGRFYEDYTPEKYAAAFFSPLNFIMKDAVQEEVDNEMMNTMRSAHRKECL